MPAVGHQRSSRASRLGRKRRCRAAGSGDPRRALGCVCQSERCMGAPWWSEYATNESSGKSTAFAAKPTGKLVSPAKIGTMGEVFNGGARTRGRFDVLAYEPDAARPARALSDRPGGLGGLRGSLWAE